jgi:hypothetical protein
MANTASRLIMTAGWEIVVIRSHVRKRASIAFLVLQRAPVAERVPFRVDEQHPAAH